MVTGTGDNVNDVCLCMQIGSYDCRHTALTLASLARKGPLPGTLHLYIYEEEPEVLARHILCLAILLDTALPTRDRVGKFLEVHSNARLQQRTAQYVGECLLVYI